MTRKKIMSSGQGVFSVVFLIIALMGTVFQFTTLFQHFLAFAPGDPLFITLFSLSISAMISGGTGIIWSIFGSALVLPIYSAVTTTVFPYVIGAAAQTPWLFTLPTYPILDFVGFWMATGGGLLSMIAGFAVPKN